MSVRRVTFESYAAGADWVDYSQVSRALLVFEDFIRFYRQRVGEGTRLEEMIVKLERDGPGVDERGCISELERVASSIGDDAAAATGKVPALVKQAHIPAQSLVQLGHAAHTQPTPPAAPADSVTSYASGLNSSSAHGTAAPSAWAAGVGRRGSGVS